MTARLTQAFLAAAFAVVVGAGCSGDPCDDVSCRAGEVCEEGVCKADGLCANKTCNAGLGCNPADGNCVNLCQLPTAEQCTAPATCAPETGKCVNKCAGVTCTGDTLACNPQSGVCEPKCKPTTCTASQTCVPTTGECINKCETATKPNGQPECASGLKCQATTGLCVTKCTDVVCPYAQWCEEATGTCKSGKPAEGRPGAACEEDADCGVDGAPEGQEFSCRQGFPEVGVEEIPGGACTATCSQTMACPGGSVCLGTLGCLDLCAKDSDCRDLPWRCQPVGGNMAICLPGSECSKENPAECAPVGGDCMSDEDCITGAFCIAEQSETQSGGFQFSGFEGGYCLWGMRNSDTCPAGSTAALPLSQDDPTFVGCLKNCTFGQLGAQGCGLGESCYLTSETSTAGVCFEAQCTGDESCQVTSCTAQNTQFCGRGQACTNGSCRTADKCDAQNPCADGSTCDANGECAQAFCEPGLAVCVSDCRVTEGLCAELGAGTTCNAQTGKCDRGCSRNDQCGANAVCDKGGAETGVCVARCTANNEEAICGEDKVCNTTTGLCREPCESADDCATGELCTEGGRCVRSCTDETNPLVCNAAQVCNDETGFCDAKCTLQTELQLCGTEKFCQTSTGKCLADCASDESLCGGEACSVTGTGEDQIGICGVECQTDAQCGKGPGGEQLKCQGTTTKRCDYVACTAENASTTCTAGQACVEGECRAD